MKRSWPFGRIRRFGRIHRRPDSWATPHERARARAAQRMDVRLQSDENAWLDRHLAECRPCRLVAAGYDADRTALKGLGERTPEPPRDLWAKTAAAIERESAARTSGSGVPVRRAAMPLGAVSGVLVIAVVLGASLLSNPSTGPTTGGLGPSSSPAGPQNVAASPTAPRPTPIVVGAGDVGWVRSAQAGGWGYTVAKVGQVCSSAGRPDCAPIDDARDVRPIVLPGKPKSVIGSPSRGQAVIVGSTTASGNTVFVVALPRAATPAPTEPPATPTPAPTATPGPTEDPVDPPSPSPSPTVDATPTPTADSTPTPSPEPTVAAALAIASGVTVIGESAAFSPDGSWFAFTARPADGSTGPDIYVWRVGDDAALPVTTDHASVFASWLGDRLLGSRPVRQPDPVDGSALPVTFALDPATGEETVLTDAGWRPVVDPSGRFAVTWVGSIGLAADGHSWLPSDGSLVLRAWPSEDPDAELEPQVIATMPLTEFDIRWDETGTWLAVWIADPVEPTIGRLSLLRVDPVSGATDRPENAPVDVAALPGFSIGDGRLAWATPPGQEGEGSRVRIVVWTSDGVGGAESVPGEDVIVVR